MVFPSCPDQVCLSLFWKLCLNGEKLIPFVLFYVEEAMRAGAAALALTCLATASCITYVHVDQKRDLRRMQASVLYDAERESYRRRYLEEQGKASSIVRGEANPSSGNLRNDQEQGAATSG